MREISKELAQELLGAVYSAHGTMRRQLDHDGHAPDWWYDDEHETFRILNQVIKKADSR